MPNAKNSELEEDEVKNFTVLIDRKSFSTKSEDEGEFGHFSGYASTFNNEDFVQDIVATGAFTKTIAKKNRIPLLWQHDAWDGPVGSVMSMHEDAKGLFIDGRINLGTVKGQEAYALLKAGDMDSMSIGYQVIEFSFDSKSDIRTLTELELREISLVTMPANDKAKITRVKSLAQLEEAKTFSDIESVLKDKGFSNRERKTLIASIKRISEVRDASQAEEKKRGDAEDLSSMSKWVRDELALITKKLNSK